MSVLIVNRIPYSPVLLQPMKHSHHMNEWNLLPLRTRTITWMTPLIHIQMIHPHVSLVHHLIQFISLPLSATTLFFHHFTVPFPVGAFLHWMNNEYMLVTLHKVTSTNNHVHTSDVFNGCGSLIHRCLLQRQQTVHVHQQLGRNNFRTTPWSSQPYRVHTRSLATNRTDKREGIVNKNRSSLPIASPTILHLRCSL